MSHRTMACRTLCACAAAAALSAAGPAAASATSLNAAQAQIAQAVKSASTANCTPPAQCEPFSAFGDTNEYALVPGETADSFTGSGWTLLGGAKIVTETLADRTSGDVLDLPNGSVAISPAMCVTNAYPTARTMVRSVKNASIVDMYVTYMSVSPSLVSVGALAPASSSTTWAPSSIMSIDPSSASGWQLAWFTFNGSGGGSDSQLYNLYIDPRMKL